MRFKKPIVATTATLALVGSLSGVALAAKAGTNAPSTSEAVTAVDTDNVQQGDQTSPDVQSSGADGTTNSTGSESAGESSEATGETEAPSDGPGGHEDPAGQNVDHQFNGEE